MDDNKNYICGVVEGFYGRPWTTEQRKHLFSLLRRFGMNTYLYAPKDDLKHRAEWRILYTAEEAALLESLIKTANENGITFVYALSPGIDIVYSSAKEMKAIQDKLKQVRSLGCTAFSLLFDDIETKMNEMDKKQFSSFALAQLTVANAIFEFLDCPIFLFCPTEYCESCAVPNLDESQYLSLLGAKLHPDIHILWTGPRVVSRLLTTEHLQRVSSVLRRKPMIWDNLHANDYDPKRVFMGPFVGRSVAIKNETSGLLLNPNCKYEANYIPFFTLSDWVQSEMDAPKVEEDQNVVLESTVSEEAVKLVERSKSTRLYHPLTSLRRALDHWLPQFGQGPGPTIPPLSQLETQAIIPLIVDEQPVSAVNAEVPPPTIRTCEGNEMLSDLPAPIYTSPIGHATTVCVQAFPLSEAVIGVVEAHDAAAISKAPQTVNSLTTDYNEPMDIPTTVSKTEDLQIADGTKSTAAPMDLDIEPKKASDFDQKTVQNIDLESIALFVDIFYLPFEHGRRGLTLLNELKWLCENAQILRTDCPNEKETEEWHRRFAGFEATSRELTELYRNIIKSPNKSLLQEIFPYLWEAQGLVSVLCALLEWMRRGNLLLSPSGSPSWTNDEVDPDSEPWALGGGLLPDLQKLIVTSPKLGEIFTVKFAIPLNLRCYQITPLNIANVNKVHLFDLFAQPEERQLSELVTGNPLRGEHSPEEFFFDRTFAPFLKYGVPTHHFIAESAEEEGASAEPCSLALGILNVPGIVDDYRDGFLAKFREKYARREKESEEMEADSDGEEEITSMLEKDITSWMSIPLRLSQDFLSTYQSMIEIRWPINANEAVSVRRLLHCVSASLALNGSTGFFTVVNSEMEEKIDLLIRLGLKIIEHADCEQLTGFTVMGHPL